VTSLPSGSLADVQERYPVRLTPYLERLIAEGPSTIARQFLPDVQELHEYAGLLDDPLAEERYAPHPSLVHRHPDRVLLLVSDRCAAICRFCFRKGRSFKSYAQLSPVERDHLFAYLAEQPSLREIILTGGDPLTAGDEVLEALLERLSGLGQVETLRLHTRQPVVDPGRVTPRLLGLLRRHQPLFLMLHVNHPHELTAPLAAACERLADAGIPLGSQTVLLKGVNDEPAVLEELFRGLLRLRVRPYYLHHPDVARGTGHFRVPLEEGSELVRELSRRMSALAIPRYVIDLPGGLGKLEVTETSLVSGGSLAVLKDSAGRLVEVPNRL